MGNKTMWYDKSVLLSQNCLWNVSLGARGVGKTFAYKLWAIEKGGECVWVRRYKEDILELEGTFLTDLITEGKIDVEKDGYFIMEDTLYVNDEPKVHFLALSTSRRKKSQSFANVDRIIFDEFLEGYGGRYLKNEYQMWLELYETVARLRDVRVVFIANKTSFVNPYFVEWKVKPFTERVKKFKVGLEYIAVENYSNKEFTDYKKETKFGRLIAGSDYSNYAIDNEVWLDDSAMIANKPDDARLLCNIRDGSNIVGLWTDTENYYCSWKINKQRPTFSYQAECRENEYALRKTTAPVVNLLKAWDIGHVYFEDNVIKSIMFDVMITGGKRSS